MSTAHALRRMTGRDPHQPHRAATPLELLFDLAFVIAFGIAADELTHALTTDRVADGIIGFCFAAFAICWAWINFTWFASAYDTDDWLYRLTTMVQMLGVVVLALGLSDMFASLEEGEVLDNRVMVLGYVVMRTAMIAQWARAARQHPDARRTCLTYVVAIGVAQVLWIGLAIAEMSVTTTLLCVVAVVGIEAAGPIIGERQGDGTPWHPHHVAERYGLLIIIALGEGLIGTVASLEAVIGEQGWTLDVAVLGLAGVALPFGLWWLYFALPLAELLAKRPERSFTFGYGQIVLISAVVAVGAGLHVAAYYVEDHSDLAAAATVLSVVIPTGIFLLGVFAINTALTHSTDPFHLVLIVGIAVFLVAGVLLTAAGVSLVWSLGVVALAPWVGVVGYETVGHRHNEDVLAGM